MRAMWGTMRAELVGAGGVVERNAYLTRRYIWWDVAWFIWTVANTLTIVFIAKGMEASGGRVRRERVHDVPAHRGRRLGLSRHPLRLPHGDRRLGALGRDDRVHVHGTALACDAPGGPGRVRDPLRAHPRRLPVRRLCALLQPFDAGRELHGGARDPRHLVDLVHRHRDHDLRPAAHLAGEGNTAGLHRAGDAARRLGRLLPRRASCPTGCSSSRSSRPRRTRSRASVARSSTATGSRSSETRSGRSCSSASSRSRSVSGCSGAVSSMRSATGSSSGADDGAGGTRRRAAQGLRRPRARRGAEGGDEESRPAQDARGARRRRHLVRDRAGRDRRLPRAERRRQDDDAQDALRAALPERRRGSRAWPCPVEARAGLPPSHRARHGQPEPAAVGPARARLVRAESLRSTASRATTSSRCATS